MSRASLVPVVPKSKCIRLIGKVLGPSARFEALDDRCLAVVAQYGGRKTIVVTVTAHEAEAVPHLPWRAVRAVYEQAGYRLVPRETGGPLWFEVEAIDKAQTKRPGIRGVLDRVRAFFGRLLARTRRRA